MSYKTKVITHPIEEKAQFEKELSDTMDSIKKQTELMQKPGMVPLLDRFFFQHIDEKRLTVVITWSVENKPIPAGMGGQIPGLQ